MPLLMQSLLTPEEVAQKLKLPQRTIIRWLRSGFMPGIKLGKEWRINPEDLEEFIRTHQNIQEDK
jgi:excisionase family DNA binding protein